MHADGRLAAARAALNDDDARVRPRDELELTRVEQGCDLGQMTIFFGRERRARAERAFHVLRTNRLALSTRKLGRATVEPAPPTLGPHEDALRRSDSIQITLVDGDRSPREDLALDLAITKRLLVFSALFVAVVELADRSVAPIDDTHASLRVDVCRAADENVSIRLAALAQAKVPKIRRTRIHRLDHNLGPTRSDARDALHLLHQRRDILEAARRDLISKRDELRLVVLRRGRFGWPNRRKVLAHA